MAFLDETGLAEVWSQVDEKFGRFETGTYRGTGTFGVDNPCSLTFSFEPKLICFMNPGVRTSSAHSWERIMLSDKYFSNGTTEVVACMYESTYGNYISTTIKFELNGKTLNWYLDTQGVAGNHANTQMNSSGQDYKYFAFG